MTEPVGQRPHVLVLPGMDGTGRLLASFRQALQATFDEVTVLSYPTHRVLAYSELEAFVVPALPVDRPFLLIGESFSGPIALAIAARRPPGLTGVVLVVSFARSPTVWPRLIAALVTLVPIRLLPARLIAGWLLGRWRTPALASQLRSALDEVASAVLRARALATLHVDAGDALDRIEVPLLYLRASEDRLMPRSAGEFICNRLPAATIVELPGPHLLLEVSPVACAQAIARFAGAIGR